MSASTTTSPVTAEMIADARTAGASDLFILAAAARPERLQIGTNKVANRLALMHGDTADAEGLAERAATSGSFMSALWYGNLPTALYRADGDNSRLLFRLLNPTVILGALAVERGSMESAESWAEPYFERYGFDADDE